MSPVSTMTCETCGAPLEGTRVGGAHCSRCLFKVSLFGDMPEPDAELEGLGNGAPWTQISGYELHEEMGRGGMGVVYRARQKALERTVAVKVLLRAQFASGEEKERFHREAQAAARLQHPGIVGIFDVGEDDGIPWFSMEHIPGQSLERAVREHPMEAREAARCVRAVATALQHAHDHGVLHRDLKPSNILLDRDGSPRITDFGIARIAAIGTGMKKPAELTQTGQILGSPGYAAPEQVLDSHADVRTDVYGLGALLYHLLTGRPPFQAPTLDAILMQLREDDPLPPGRMNPTVPKDLETICLKCLQKQPEARYASAAETAADLDRFLEGVPILARPLSPLAKAWRVARRRPMLAFMSVTIGLLVAVMIAGTVSFIRHQTQQEHRTGLISEARSLRQQRLSQNRQEALRNLKAAWDIRPSEEIRNEAIACLALPEIRDAGQLAAGAAGTQPPDLSRSADGRRSARFENGVIVVTETEGGKEITRLKGHAPGSLLKLDDDGSRLAIAVPKKGDLRLISLADGQVTATCQHPAAITSLDWSGDLLATGCANRFVYIWDDAGRMKHRLSGHQAGVILVRFRPRSQELCSMSQDAYLRLWHGARGEEILYHEIKSQPLHSLWWSEDGQRVFARMEKGGVMAYEVPASPCFQLLAPPQEEPHSENLGSADFSKDGRLAAVIDEESCRVWDFHTGRLVGTVPRTTNQWLSAKFSPDSRRLWTCGWDLLLAARPLQPITGDFMRLGPPGPTQGEHGNLIREVHADGRLVLSNNTRGHFLVVNPESRKTLKLKHPGTLATAMAHDGTWLMTSSFLTKGAHIWSLPEGRVLTTLAPDSLVSQACLSADGQRLLMLTSTGNRCFRTSDWTEIPDLPPKLRLKSITFSPDGRWLATLGDNEIRLLDAVTYRDIAHLPLPAYVGWLGESHLLFDAASDHLIIHTALGSVGRWDLDDLDKELVRHGFTAIAGPPSAP